MTVRCWVAAWALTTSGTVRALLARPRSSPARPAVWPRGGSGDESFEVAGLLRQPLPVAGLATILLPAERVLLPGATRSLHLYDANLLLALEHSLARDGGRLVLLGYDPRERRRLALHDVGVLAAVTSVEPTTRVNFRGETSPSRLISVAALWPVVSPRLTQREPFVRAELGPVAEPDAPDAAQLAEIMAAHAAVAALRAALRVGVLPATADGRPDDTAASPGGAWPAEAAAALAAAAVALKAAEEAACAWAGPEGTQHRAALAAAQHLLPPARAGALGLRGAALGVYVLQGLREARAQLEGTQRLEALLAAR
jgi:hypothetical protein